MYWVFYFGLLSLGYLYSAFLARNQYWFRIFIIFPYEFAQARLKKPPDILVRLFDLMLTIISFLIVVSICIKVLIFRGRNTESTNENATFLNHQVYANAAQHSPVAFGKDDITAFFDNCSNTHICNNEELFDTITMTPNLEGSDTIHGTAQAAGIGTVTWSWYSDKGELYSWKFENVYYYPTSPVNVISVPMFGKALEDSGKCNENGATIKSGTWSSEFVWEDGKFLRTIVHPKHNLPEATVIPGKKPKKNPLDLLGNAIFALYGCIDKKSCSGIHSDDVYSTDDLVKFLKAEDHKFSLARIIDINVPDQWLILKLPNGKVIDFPADPSRVKVVDYPSKLPSKDQKVQRAEQQLNRAEIVELLKQKPLSNEQKELLSWHYRLKHLSEKLLKRLAKIGAIPRHLADVKLPPCFACISGETFRRSWRSGAIPNTIRKAQDFNAGAMVSTDQLISADPGLVPQVTGKLTSSRIWGATVFIDHATNFSHVHLMQRLTTDNTVTAKLSFESKMHEFGADVKHYRADNGRYNDVGFRESLQHKDQRVTFCGVGTHNQNGIAEKHIGDLTRNARTILLHAQTLWPEMISTMLWPYALRAASDRHNELNLDDNGFSPLQKISKSSTIPNLKDNHTWGCPVFVLQAGLQSGLGSIPKWEPRCRVGVYLGRSPAHAGSVALVLNPRTGHVSPQYHVVFDDDFSTVPYMRQGSEPPNWNTLVDNARELTSDREIELSDNWVQQSQIDSTVSEGDVDDTAVVKDSSSTNDMVLPTTATPVTSVSEGVPTRADPEVEQDLSFGTDHGPPGRDSLKQPNVLNLSTAGLRRSSRSKKPVSRLNLFLCFGTFLSETSQVKQLYSGCKTLLVKKYKQVEELNQILGGQVNEIHPMTFLAALTDNDTYTFQEAMKQEDNKDFIQAMIKEVADHTQRGHWEYVRKVDMEADAEVIMAIWSFKRKRYPDGRVMKHKARLCAHGGQQTWGVSYWETYAPVVDWISIRIVLVVALLFDMPMKSVDFVLAFPQAELDSNAPIYMKPPLGMDITPGYVIKLKKSLYGLKNAGFNWYEHLRKGLLARGFIPSLVDQCVYYKNNCIILVYVDDCVVTGKSQQDIDDFLKSLEGGDENYDFTVDEDFKNYLGVEVTLKEDGTIHLTQTHLIQRIISAIGYDENTKSKETPAMKPMLNKDLNGESRKYDWHYRSIIGMLTYLQKTSRPDLSLATHQCARFTIDPKLSHEKALGRIVKYLIGTQDKGLIFRPNKDKGLECFADADFAGMWEKSTADDPAHLLSRTGYVIYYCGCPIFWQSKLQTEIALSTTEAEYIALSTALRQLIPTMNLLKEISKHLNIPYQKPKMGSKMLLKEFPDMSALVHEDNKSCIAMTKSFKLTPRTKHIGLKYHHFRGYIERKIIGINYVESEFQVADIFTKPLAETDFVRLRKLLCGW